MNEWDVDERPPVVLGQQMAAAITAEECHRAIHTDPSPLADIAYDSEAGEFDLARFRSASTDDSVRAFVRRFVAADDLTRRALRAALTMDDFYTLLNFSRRSALMALRERNGERATEAVEALAAIDVDRIDPRDLSGWLAACALDELGADRMAILSAVADLAPEPVAQHLFALRTREVVTLTDCAYLAVDGPTGLGLIDRRGDPYSPECDLATCALEFAELLDADRYHVAGISARKNLPLVWLPRAVEEEAAKVLSRCHGGIGMDARLRKEDPAYDPANPGGMFQQKFLVHFVEAATTEDAGHLATWAVPTGQNRYAHLAVTSGPLFALVVNASGVVGGSPAESDESLSRFSGPLRSVLDSALPRAV